MLVQYDLIHIELTFQLGDQLLDALFVRRQPAVLLEHPFYNNASGDRIKLRVFDARRLLELCARLGIGGDQLRAGPEGREVSTDSARLEELETIVLLHNRVVRDRASRTRTEGVPRKKKRVDVR